MRIQDINRVIAEAIDELNELKPEKEQVSCSPEMALYGKDSPLDSVDLVNVLLAIEEKLEDEFDLTFTIANEKAMSMRNSPFRTVATLSDYLATELVEA